MKKLFIVLIVLIFIGCSRTNEKNEKLVFNRQMIQLTIDSLEELKFENNSKIIFQLWGYDLYVADVSATLLKEYKYNFSKLPVTYGIDYKKKWDKKIKPVGSNKYGYYITLEIESQDGKKYKIDYETTDKGYFGTIKTKVKELSGKIYIKEVK